MERDCEILSPEAQKIFDKLELYFPPGPFGGFAWQKEGKVSNSNVWHDLRKGEDRDKLAKEIKGMIGEFVAIDASIYKKGKGSLNGFSNKSYPRMVHHAAEILIIIEELEKQIYITEILGG